MENIISQKLIDNKKVLQIVLVTTFFTLFLSNLTSVAFAQYDIGGYGSYGDVGGYGSYGDVGGYGSYGDVGGYGSYGDVGGYSYPSIGYNYYTYPSLTTPGVPTYSTSYGSYEYPSLNIPGVPTYSTSYGSYTYPSLTVPGVPTYSTSYGSYTYPSLTTPGVPTYSTSYGTYSYPSYYPGGYSYYSGVAYAGTIANVPTGPENTLPLILSGGLALSVFIYLIVFKIRFGKKLTLAAAYQSFALERRLKKIREKETRPDFNVIQS